MSSLARILGALGSEASSLTALLEQLPAGIAIFDERGRPLLHNRSLSQILGVIPATVQEIDFVGEDGSTLPARVSPMARALAGEMPNSAYLHLRPAAAGAAPRRVEVSAIPARDQAGVVVGGVLVVNPARGDAREGEAIQREVMGIVGHDLRNPLAAIRMTAQLLGKPDEMAGERRVTLANRILTSSTRMDSIVRSLLDYARTRGGAIVRLNREQVDLGALVHRVIEEQEVAFPGRAIRQEVTGDVTGRWDPGRVEQIVANLVSNALRHGSDSHPIDVRVDGSSPTDVQLTVDNQGSPIPPEELPRLFDAFHIGARPEGAPRRNIGLGLFIVKELVAAHGGSVAVRSAVTDGTRFTVTLPRTAPPEE